MPAYTGDPAFDQAAWGGECTYGYDCEMVGSGLPLHVTILDISDRTAPVAIRTLDFSGALLAARRIDATTYTAVVFPDGVNQNLLAHQGVASIPDALWGYRDSCGSDLPFTYCEINALFDELAAENLAIIADLSPEVVTPSGTERTWNGTGWDERSIFPSDCSDLLFSVNGRGFNRISLVSLQATTDAPATVASALGRPGAVYASVDSFYVAAREYNGTGGSDWYDVGVDEATTLHRFALDPAAGSASYAGTAVVKGRVLNQFSMSERDGHLRLATTTGHLPDLATHSTLSILRVEDDGLVLTGQVDDIAPSEDIRSVRFGGDKAYVVTFKKTDPLFVIDLADPAAPAILGELKIPGYSTYMHFLDANHLLTIGFDADDMGDFAWFDGLQLQIVDLTDPTLPTLLHREVIGTRGSNSEAATNHLAFNYFASRGLLALPLTVCEGGGDGAYGYDMTFSGLRVYSVSVDDGFADLGGVPHAAASSGEDYWSTCGGWWTNPNTAVQRSVFMEDYVFSIAPELIEVSAVADLAHPLTSVDLSVSP